MDLRAVDLAVSFAILVFGLGLTAAPFLIHEHTHPGHLKLKANAHGDVRNQSNVKSSGNTVRIVDLSGPVRRVVRELIEHEGEYVIFHTAELINGDEHGDWEPDNAKERQANVRLRKLAENKTGIIANNARYTLTEDYDVDGFIPVVPLVLLVGIPMLVYGAYDVQNKLRDR